MSDGVKGGDVNRPGSGPEIKKLPRETCVRCGMQACAPIVLSGRCANVIACDLRIERRRGPCSGSCYSEFEAGHAKCSRHGRPRPA